MTCLLFSQPVEHLGHSHILLATFEKVGELLWVLLGFLTSGAANVSAVK